MSIGAISAALGNLERQRPTFSPLEIHTLLHHYALRQPFPLPSPAYGEAVHRWAGLGCLRRQPENETEWEVTEKGRCMVEAICATPLPVGKWIGANGAQVIQPADEEVGV